MNWNAIIPAAFTAIRCNWSLDRVLALAADGNDTPVSGDVLAEESRWRKQDSIRSRGHSL